MRYSFTASLRPYRDHPLARAAARSGDVQAHIQAAEEAASIEVTLRSVRRRAKSEPPAVLIRTIELALAELRLAVARHWSREAEAWQRTVLQELGGLLFTHAASRVEIEIRVGERALRLARANGDA